MSAWWADEARQLGLAYRTEQAIVSPKPAKRPRPVVFAGGESEAAKQMIAERCDAYVMHGDPPAVIGRKIDDMRQRRERAGKPPLQFGAAGYFIVRETEREAREEVKRITNVRETAGGYRNYEQWLANTTLEQQVSLEDYSVSNRGLRSGLVGTREQLLEQIDAFERVGVDLLLLQCSPQLEEMEKFGRGVIGAAV